VVRHRELAELTKRLEEVAIDENRGSTRQSTHTTAQVLLGALNTAARMVSTAAEPESARTTAEETISRLLKELGLP
jgi:hypothetical protein